MRDDASVRHAEALWLLIMTPHVESHVEQVFNARPLVLVLARESQILLTRENGRRVMADAALRVEVGEELERRLAAVVHERAECVQKFLVVVVLAFVELVDDWREDIETLAGRRARASDAPDQVNPLVQLARNFI